MAESENKRVLTTQQLKAKEEAKKTGKVVKKSRRRMKKQVRKTIAGLLLASALVVCAIPVQETRASVPTSQATTWVKALNYTSNISQPGTWEDAPCGSVIEEWKSYVPLVDTDTSKYPIYTTSTSDNTVQYRFAFVPSENGSGTNVAVILGANTSKVENNTLTIDDKIDAFKKYSYNTSVTNFCAVSMDDSFLYYPTKSQRKDGTVGFYKVVNNEYEPLGADETYKDIKDGYTNLKETGTKPSGTPSSETEECDYLYIKETFKRDESSSPVLNVVKISYKAVVDTEEVVEEETVYTYKWEEVTEDTTYQLEESTIDMMQPCYDSAESSWSSFLDSELYYWKGTSGEPDLTNMLDFDVCGNTSTKQRIHDVEVWYIGRQYVEETTDGVWTIKGEITEANPEKGIFAGLTNVTYVNIPSTMQGIGDCAFYGCQIKSVKFADNGSIRTIGNGAFANCISLSEFYIPLYSQVKVIGENAFYNDYSLSSFTLPTSVYAIGDYAFSGCTGLQYVDFTSGGNANYLNAIGYRAFENCTSLTSVTFPEKFLQDSSGFSGSLADITNKIPITTFDGCINLQSITIKNNTLDIADGYDPDESEDDNHAKHGQSGSSGCDIDIFLSELADSDGFYFEGNTSSDCAIYETAKAHGISYKHIGEEIYERVVECDEDPKHTNTYTVNSQGEIVDMEIDPECTVIKIPEKVGKFGIKTLSSTSFTGNCNIKKVYIPSSIELIQSGAFKGCHQLADVVFTQPENSNLVIETGAFATQEVDYHESTCSTSGEMAKTPYLSFTGTISDTSAPFNYAMNPDNNINNGQQTAHTYITFFSGWPTNLTVHYDFDTDKNTLIDVPKYQELENIKDKVIKVRNPDGTYTEHKLPYLTDANITASENAVINYENYVSDPRSYDAPTQDEYDIINSALNLVLPSGIEAIETGLFSNLDAEGCILDDEAQPDLMLNSITMYTVEEIEPYAFVGLNNDGSTLIGGKYRSTAISAGLSGFYQSPSGCLTIGDYAFRNNKALNGVNIAATVTSLGLRPFMGCDSLTGISFNDGSYYTCSNQIIYQIEDGANSKIIECLECRGTSAGNALVGPSELASVTSMADEAFMDCDGVGQVDLSESQLAKVSEKAFALMDGLGSVKLPEDYCKSIGRGAFWQTGLYYIEIPSSTTLIQADAFANVETVDYYQDVITKKGSSTSGKTYQAEGDSENQFIYFKDNGEPEYQDQSSGHKTITAYCVEGSAADVYSDDYYYINAEYYKPSIYHTVYFWDTYDTSNPVLVDEQKVLDGESAVPPELPVHEGKAASSWTPDYTCVVRDSDVTTVYSDVVSHIVWFQSTDPNTGETTQLTEKQVVEDGKTATPPAEDPSADGYVFNGWIPDYRNIYDDGAIVAWWVAEKEEDKHTVSFYDWSGTLYMEVKVSDGETLTTIPTGPDRSGYTFTGWAPNNFSNITKDLTVVACYEKIVVSPSPSPSASASPSSSSSPTPTPTATKTPTPTPSPTPTASPTVKTYTCTVSGGSGTGTYIAGQVVPINAYDMGTGQTFDRWTTSTANVAFGNAENATTYFVMPANNVAVTATFKAGGNTASSSSSSGSGSTGSSSGGSASKGNTGTSSNPSATSVQVTKGGISNTGVAGATVSGSTDNFIVKVTDDQSASDTALTALQNKFGDITQIKYLPMDISLYDSTGRTKIADTSGMSVNLTLPLPDDLVSYAGNNKIASVKGGVVEDLNSRFTTVDGVPCINFTATHFSPYVIYVDTANLTESTIDYTPKTGDPIHPKWFLALGLAGAAIALFFKKDRKVPVSAKG